MDLKRYLMLNQMHIVIVHNWLQYIISHAVVPVAKQNLIRKIHSKDIIYASYFDKRKLIKMITLPNECKLIQVYIVVTLLGDGNELPGYRLDQTYIRRDVCVIYSPDRCRREKTSCICLSSFTIMNGGTRQTVSYCFLSAVSSVIYSYNS